MAIDLTEEEREAVEGPHNCLWRADVCVVSLVHEITSASVEGLSTPVTIHSSCP